MTKLTKDIRAILKDEMTQALINDLGIQGETPEAQAALIAQLGDNIMGRVMVEILDTVPADKHEALAQALESGDLQMIESTIAPHVPDKDVDAFIRGKVKAEIEETKKLMEA